METKDAILAIDLMNLEVNAAEHARLVRQWGDKLSIARKDAALAEQKVDLVKAELNKAMRARPQAHGINSSSETAIAAAIKDNVILSPIYQKALIAKIDADKDVSDLFSMISALNARGAMIEVEAKLHGQKYWAKPDINQASNDRNDTMTDVSKALTESRKKRTT